MFFKFPSTKHLAVLQGLRVRNDKVMSDSDREAFLGDPLIVEEKIDGANLGISFDEQGDLRLQNRGSYLALPGMGQWKKLEPWITPLIDALFESLTDRFILFGEWCYARHSIYYERLPDWFLGFDVYDKKNGRFLSIQNRDLLLSEMGIARIPLIGKGLFTLADLEKKLAVSKFSSEPSEGIYLRMEQDGWLEKRAKLVRPKFVQSQIRHWSDRTITPNKLYIASGY